MPTDNPAICSPQCMALAVLGESRACGQTVTDQRREARTFSARLADGKPAPLVIVLHGNTQTGADMASRTSWPQVAKREQFAVGFSRWAQPRLGGFAPLEPRAAARRREGTDDVAFIAKLVEKYVADGTADPKRIYVTGLSNGGAMTMTLACKHADLFAAAASVIMNFTDEFAGSLPAVAAGANADDERHRRSLDPL